MCTFKSGYTRGSKYLQLYCSKHVLPLQLPLEKNDLRISEHSITTYIHVPILHNLSQKHVLNERFYE